MTQFMAYGRVWTVDLPLEDDWEISTDVGFSDSYVILPDHGEGFPVILVGGRGPDVYDIEIGNYKSPQLAMLAIVRREERELREELKLEAILEGEPV